MDYGIHLAKLLPPGLLWLVEEGSGLRKLFAGLGDELERVRLRGVDLINEVDPSTADETIEDWERILGLPDDRVTVIAADLVDRQVATAAKYTAREGQNYAFFAALCATCGYPLDSIDLFADQTFRSGSGMAGYPLYGGQWAFTMQLNVTNDPSAPALTSTQFEAVIAHVTHAHITVIFNYL